MADMKEETHTIVDMFDTIAGRYDLANRVISLGADQKWRRVLVDHIRPCATMLDLACGTGDLSILAAETRSDVGRVVAADASVPMLKIAQSKVGKKGIANIETAEADMHDLPFDDGAFDCATMVFGLRNAVDRPKVMSELNRVVRPGGQVLIMEFSLPRSGLLKLPYQFYLGHIMPLIGWVVTRKYSSYRYLFQSVSEFYQPGELSELLTQHGLPNEVIRVAYSTVWLYDCRKG